MLPLPYREVGGQGPLAFLVPDLQGVEKTMNRKGSPSLTPEQVQAIRQRNEFGGWARTAHYWAQELQLSTDWVRKIRRGECYIWVPPVEGSAFTGDRLLEELEK